MCIVGFLQLRLLRYKNKRENGNLIAKNWQSYEKKMFFLCWNGDWCLFVGHLGTNSCKKQQLLGSFIFCGQKKLESKCQTALKSNYWLQSIVPTTNKSMYWLQSTASTKLNVTVDCNQYLQLTLKEEIFSNQCFQRHSKVAVDCNQAYGPQWD